MMVRRFGSVMKTTAVRLSALYVLLFGLVAVCLALYMTNLSISMLTEQTRQALEEEVANIEESYQRGGIALLVRTIDRRSRQPGAFLYLIAEEQGQILAGNVRSIGSELLIGTGHEAIQVLYSRLEEGGEERIHKAMALVIDLPNRMKLMVGRDMGDPQRFVEVIQQAFLLALAVMAIGAFLIWFFVGRKGLQRIDNIAKASQKLMQGDLSGRLPETGTGDEFDRLSQNLNIMLERIEALNGSLRQMSDNIAHDLRTPLTRLRNRAEEALSHGKKDAHYRDALSGIITESDQLMATFNAILMISRLESGQKTEQLELANIRLIMEETIEFYQPVAEEAGAVLCGAKMWDAHLYLNRQLIAQALFNLVDNAIKYAPKDDTQSVTITIFMEQKLDELWLVVADSGTGIPEHEHEKVFERFYRLEKSRTQPGSGIGLSLASAIAKLHHGRLLLENNEPGLRAILAFPYEAKTVPDSSPPQHDLPHITEQQSHEGKDENGHILA